MSLFGSCSCLRVSSFDSWDGRAGSWVSDLGCHSFRILSKVSFEMTLVGHDICPIHSMQSSIACVPFCWEVVGVSVMVEINRKVVVAVNKAICRMNEGCLMQAYRSVRSRILRLTLSSDSHHNSRSMITPRH